MSFKIVNVGKEVINELEEAYKNDEHFKEQFKKMEDSCRKTGKSLYFENRPRIPKGTIREIIMHDNHESLLGAHRGSKKTLSLITRHSFGQV